LRIRKPVSELSLEDLRQYPVWEFALDEEGHEGQDETTVRPYSLTGHLDPADGMFIIQAGFHLSDGTVAEGYMTPPFRGDKGLGTLQPVIVTPSGQVGFWCGVIAPSRQYVNECYARLGKTGPGSVFPLHFESAVPLVGGPVEGEISGFIVTTDWARGVTRVEI
jgi:hypothetical protein